MAITYNAGTNTITVTGYTSGTPCTFLDIYNADVAGSWGKVTRQCTNQFCFSAFVVIGDGSTATWFADKGIHAHWSNIWTAHWQIAMRGRLSSHITLTGCTISIIISSWATVFGGDIVLSSEYAPDFNMYYCLVSALSAGGRPLSIYGMTGDVEHCVFYNCTLGYTSNLNVKDVTIDLSDLALTSAYGLLDIAGGTLDDIKIYNTYSHVYVTTPAPSSTFKNLVCDNASNPVLKIGANALSHYFINCIFDSVNWDFTFSGSFSGTIYRQYEFDLKVIDKDNVAINAATVKIWDKDSNLIVDTTTNVSGVIATQTITRGTYAQATGNTLQEKSPHLIKIEKAGYTTYEADFTLDEKTDWLIALQVGGGGLMRNPPMTGGMV